MGHLGLGFRRFGVSPCCYDAHQPHVFPLLVHWGEVGPAAATFDQSGCPYSLGMLLWEKSGLDTSFVFVLFCHRFPWVCLKLGGNATACWCCHCSCPTSLSGWLALYIFNGILYCFSCTAPGYFAVCIFVDGCNESIANNNLSLEGTEFAKQLTIHTCWKHGEKSPA